jgi:hypothetical protein
MVYRSKKDLWLFGLVWGAVLAPLAVGLFNVFAPAGNVEVGWVLVRVGVVVAAAVLFTTYPLNYEIAAGELVARSGIMRWRVSLDSIQEVRPRATPRARPRGRSTASVSST